MEVEMSNDEQRLLRLFRALPSEHERNELLESLASGLFESHFPDRSVYDFMPSAGGIEPRGSIWDVSSIAHVLYCGMEETGDPSAVLLGSSHWDEEEAIPRFAYGASRIASEQGSFFDYDREFARTYLTAWRREIVDAIVSRGHDGAET